MPELEAVSKPRVAGYVDRSSNQAKRDAKLEQEEKELEELLASQKGGDQKTSEEDPEEEDENSEPEQEEEQKLETKEEEQEKEESEPETKEEKTWKKRYADLRRHSQKQKQDLEKRIEALEKGDTNQIKPLASDEDVETWKKKYPEVAGIVEAVAHKIADERVKTVEESYKELAEDKDDILLEKMRDKVRKVHKDFDDIVDSDPFHDWVEKKAEHIQNIVYDNLTDADSFIDVMTLYKTQTNYKSSDAAKKQKQKEKDAATEVRKPSSRKQLDADTTDGWFRESEITKMSDKEYEKMEAKVDEARLKGKIINDVTAALR